MFWYEKCFGMKTSRFCHIIYAKLLWASFFNVTKISGFALPIAIVAKCEEIIILAQKILIWWQLLAKEKSQVYFSVWRRNRHLLLQVIASCRLMVINVYLNCQLTPQLTTTQFSSWSSQTWTRADNLGPSINVYNLRRSAHTFNSCYR